VYRLSIHNSVEERILELQEAKRKLATAALEGGKAMGKLDMKDIMALFRREAEYEPGSADQPDDAGMYRQTRVLESGDAETVVRKARKAGSLGFGRKEGRDEGVYGRR
jgi:hypothetical protein